jgi:hypothetical protein
VFTQPILSVHIYDDRPRLILCYSLLTNYFRSLERLFIAAGMGLRRFTQGRITARQSLRWTMDITHCHDVTNTTRHAHVELDLIIKEFAWLVRGKLYDSSYAIDCDVTVMMKCGFDALPSLL